MSETAPAPLATTSLARRMDPDEAIAQAKKWADALMEIVNRTKISVVVKGRKYLKVEAWQTLARFNHCWIDTEWTKDIRDDQGQLIGVEARARLLSLDTGQTLGGAEGACMMDEEFEKDDGTTVERWGDYFAVKSMAQTRAQGKVGRMAYAWVAVLAGYEGTPAEEMTSVSRPVQVDAMPCPKCGKSSSIIKGKAEYGGGWVCFKKKGGCGAKFTDEEWAASVPASAPEVIAIDIPAPLPSSPQEDRNFMLGRIKGLSDKKGLKASERAELWHQYCQGATPDTVDVSALSDLYAAIITR